MGCSSSMDANSDSEEPVNGMLRWQASGMDPTSIVEEYVQLDEKISKLESSCPGPRMATVEAWIEHLQTQRDQLSRNEDYDSRSERQEQLLDSSTRSFNNDDIDYNLHNQHKQIFTIKRARTQLHQQQQRQLQNEQTTELPSSSNARAMGNGVLGNMRSTNSLLANTPAKDLALLALNLGVINDVQKASTHEDFFANLSESSLHLLSIQYFTEILEHNKVRLKTLSDMFAELNELYVNHDGIIAFISGGTYMSRLEEQMDGQLEAARDVRDKLGSAMEQWRISGTLLRASANSATYCLKLWKSINNIKNPKSKIEAALECRQLLQGSLVSLDCAQLAVPHVEMPHISNRQILAVKHCNTYMITDIANQSRFEHTTKVVTSYESNVTKASTWLYETFNKTLKKDFEKAEETVSDFAKSLRLHREEIFTAARK